MSACTEAGARHEAASLDQDSPLGARLRASRVRIRTEDDRTIVLRGVPTNRGFFNKPGTNVMVKQPKAGQPYLIAVDEDLLYTGADPILTRAFAGGTTQQGWRIVFLDTRVDAPMNVIVEAALRAVGFDEQEPVWAPAGATLDASHQSPMLSRFGREIPAAPGCQNRNDYDLLAGMAGSLLALHPRLPVILGTPGTGKSHLLSMLAGRLAAIEPGMVIVSVDLGQLFTGTLLESERENLLHAVLDEAPQRPRAVLALERLDLVRAETRHGTAALARAVEDGGRIVGTMSATSLELFHGSPVARHLHHVAVTALSLEDSCDALRAALPAFASHHRVTVADEYVRPLVARAATLVGPLPATALALADAACARARIDGCDAMDIAHIYIAAASFPCGEEP